MAPESIKPKLARLVSQARNSRFVTLIEDTYQSWRSDRTIRLGAGLAYYALTGIIPFLTLSVAIAGFVFTHDEVQSFLANSLAHLLEGRDVELVADAMATEVENHDVTVSFGFVGLISLVVTSALLLAALQDALNVIFGAPVAVGIRRTIRRYLILYVLVLAFASVVLVSLVLNTALTALIAAFGLDDSIVVGATVSVVTRVGATLLIVGGLAVMYRSLPYMTVPWKAAVVGAIAATCAGWIVSHAVGAYLSRFGTVSVEHAVGSVAAILAWIYMLSQIALAGAQLTNTLTLRARSDPASSANGGISTHAPTSQ